MKVRETRRVKVLLGILSTDVHTRASIVVAQALRDAGMEVVYLGFGLTPEGLVAAVEEEDPDVICLSSHEGFHMQLFPKVVALLEEREMTIPIVAGGNIQDREKPFLEGLGISGNFGSGTDLREIVEHVSAKAGKGSRASMPTRSR